jgi:hypothetical protein
MGFTIGCDLGGTNLRAGIVDIQTGKVTHLLSTPTLAREGHDAVMQRMVGLFQDVIKRSGLPLVFRVCWIQKKDWYYFYQIYSMGGRTSRSAIKSMHLLVYLSS